MRVNAAPRILAVAGLCAAILVGFVVNEGAARNNGQEILLPVDGVDPRDMLSGHYVQLEFNQHLAVGQQCPPTPEHDWNWVALRESGDIYSVVGGGESRGQVEQIGPITLKGSYNCTPPTPSADGKAPGEPGSLHLDLGLDRYYVNQAEAQRIERALAEQRNNATHRVLAIVSAGRDGQARLKGLIVDRRRLELNWL